MWVKEFVGDSTASAGAVFAVLADPLRWHEWNAGVESVVMHGRFAVGTAAVMTLPDGTELPFVFTWVEAGRGYEDLTEVADFGVTVRVRHDLAPTSTGTRITYRCEVDGPEDAAAEVGEMVTDDFTEVIAALAERAQRS